MAEIHIESQPFIDSFTKNPQVSKWVGLDLHIEGEGFGSLPMARQRDVGLLVFGILCGNCPHMNDDCTGFDPDYPAISLSENGTPIDPNAMEFTAETFFGPEVDTTQLPCSGSTIKIE